MSDFAETEMLALNTMLALIGVAAWLTVIVLVVLSGRHPRKAKTEGSGRLRIVGRLERRPAAKGGGAA